VQEELKKAKRQLKGEEAKDREAEKRFHDALAAVEAELTNERAAVDKLEQKEDELRRAKTNYEAFVRMEADQEEQVRHDTTRHDTQRFSSTCNCRARTCLFSHSGLCQNNHSCLLCASRPRRAARPSPNSPRECSLCSSTHSARTHARTLAI
jgi:hypothetical protein